MSQRYNTGNPRPSNSMKDLNDNALAYDDFINSDADEAVDRFSKPFPTVRKQVADRIDELVGASQNAIESAEIAASAAENVLFLSHLYTSVTEAQVAITAGTIPNGALFNVSVPVSSTPPRLADQYKNVDGVATLTGQTVASGEAINTIADSLPVVDRTNFWGGVIASDGAIGVAFRHSDNRPIFGNGGDLISSIDLVKNQSGRVAIYPTLADGMANQSIGDSFVLEMNGQDNLLTPCVFKKETDTMASPIFGITTDREVIHMSKSGYWGGIISGLNQIGIAFRDSDNRAIFGNGGDVVERIENLEKGTHEITTSADAYGDSIVAGSGGTPFPQQLAELIGNGFTSTNYGIGGQKSGQIAMRMGAKPTYLTLSGDAVPTNGQSVSITQINGVSATAAPTYPFMDVRLLSTNSNNTTNTLDGLICGVKCRITRTASGPNTDAKVEVYTLTALEGTGVRCLPGSLFVPLYAMQDHSSSEMWICAGINDYRSGATTSADYDNDVNAIKENIDAMVNFAERSGRKVLIFSLTNGNYAVELKDGIRYPKILEVNYYLSQKYPGYYVRSDSALDVREKMVSSYNSSIPQDVIDFGNDITPSSLRSDNRHPNTAGYAIYAALGNQFRTR
ncbi:hypothetical protein NJH77_24490, partial [Serratia fonticola]|nr:hypothetical protein [Serratia fonticola]